jgi:eukaryotic-like serine/threonine-protein kinase
MATENAAKGRAMEVLIRVTSGPHAGEEQVIDWRVPFLVGRSSRVQLSMARDLVLSREHFRIENNPTGCHLVDLGSTNGTKVNGLRVERILLREGDIITAGDSAFIVHFAEGSGDVHAIAICAGCGIRREKPLSADGEPRGETNAASGERLWLCQDCRSLRKRHPKTHPDYLIEDWIGGGGMGDVFRARQLSKNRPVAIKMMSANSAVGDKASGYFQREIGVLRDLLMPGGQSHPSIVAFYELYEIDSQFQLIMEYVDGKNALEWVKGLGQPLPISSAAMIGRHLLSALDYAHSKGYVHRDVKPSNLLVMGTARRPRVKLSDFGLAKSFAESDALMSMTRQGDVGGSIGFISPDHIRGFRDVREPADIYSAGATLYYLLTNNYPYLGFDPRKPDAYDIIFENPPVPLRAFRPDAPEQFARILQKALQKQPRDRWKSAHAMAEALRPFMETPST